MATTPTRPRACLASRMPPSGASTPSRPWTWSTRTCPWTSGWRRSRRWCRSTRTTRASRVRCSHGRSAIGRREPVAMTLVGSLINPIGGLAYDGFGNLAAGGVGGNRTTVRDERRAPGRLPVQRHGGARTTCRAGDLTLATTHPDVTIKPAWLRGAWYDFLQDFWDDLVTDGRLDDLGYPMPSEPGPDRYRLGGGAGDARPGRVGRYPVPAHVVVPQPDQTAGGPTRPVRAPAITTRRASPRPGIPPRTWSQRCPVWRRRPGASAMSCSGAPCRPRSSTLSRPTSCRSGPRPASDSEDGRFLGFEGCFDDAGSCEGTCTHVWSYAYTASAIVPVAGARGTPHRARHRDRRYGLHELPKPSHLWHRVRLAVG